MRDARAAGHAVVTIPGPCAAIAALTLAGLPTDRFLFLGFLPAKEKAKADAIAEVAAVRATLILYESGPRLAATLATLADGLGDREAAVAREISKAYEECVTAPLSALAARYAEAPPRGEIVVIVAPPGEAAAARASRRRCRADRGDGPPPHRQGRGRSGEGDRPAAPRSLRPRDGAA